MLDGVDELNRLALEQTHDPEIATRIAQYELAFRMQTAVPDLQNIQSETRQTLDSYGIKDNPTDGGFAKNCLLAKKKTRSARCADRAMVLTRPLANKP